MAVKTLRWETSQDSAALARFRQEIQLARRVTNPNVCRIHDLWEHKTAGGRSVWFLTMEFLEGETLARRLERGAIPIAEALPLVRQMAAGLDAAHQAGILHRDFKSSNVILVPRPGGLPDRAVVTDFGLSRSFDVRTTVTGAIMGTPAYMAPEQIEGGELGPATDVYALGVVMYEMLTGELPFRGASPMALAVKKVRETPRPPSHLSAGLPVEWDSAVMRCMQYRMDERLPSAAAVLEAIESGKLPALRGPDLEIRVSSLWLRVGLILLLVLAAGVAYWYRSRERAFDAKPEAIALYQEGVGKIHDGAPHVAVKLFRNSLEVDPGFVAARARLAQAYAAIEMVDASRNELVKIPSTSFASLSRKEQLLVEAARSLALNRPGEAVAPFREYVSLESGSEVAKVGLADAYLRAADLSAAIQTSDSILRGRPNLPPALLIRARARGLAGKRNEAVADARLAREQFDVRGNVDGKLAASHLLGALLLNDRNVAETEKEARSALGAAQALQNTYYETLLRQQLAAVVRKAGRYREAQAELEAAGDIARRENYSALEVAIENDLAGLAFAQSKFEDAELRYRQSVAISEKHEIPYQRARAQTGLAETYIRMRKDDQAAAVWSEASRYFSDHGMGVEALELARLSVNRLIAVNDNRAAAIQAGLYLNEATRQDAKVHREMAFRLKGHLAIVSGEIFRAFDYHHEAQRLAVREGKTIANGLLNEARLRIDIGDAAGAEKMLRSVDLASAEGPGIRAKHLQFRARLAGIRTRWQEAEDLTRQALRIVPNEADKAEIQLFLARLQVLQGRAAEAESSLAFPAQVYGALDGDLRLKFETVRAEVILAKGRPKDAAALVASTLEAHADKSQKLAVWQCALVGAAADPTSRSLGKRQAAEFEEVTSSWPAFGKQWIRGRGDLQYLFARLAKTSSHYARSK